MRGGCVVSFHYFCELGVTLTVWKCSVFVSCATWKLLDNENQPDNTCFGCRYFFGEFSRVFFAIHDQAKSMCEPECHLMLWHFTFRWNFVFGRCNNNLVLRVIAMNNNYEMKCGGDVFCLSRIRLDIFIWFSLLRGIIFTSADFGWFLSGAR